MKTQGFNELEKAIMNGMLFEVRVIEGVNRGKKLGIFTWYAAKEAIQKFMSEDYTAICETRMI